MLKHWKKCKIALKWTRFLKTTNQWFVKGILDILWPSEIDKFFLYVIILLLFIIWMNSLMLFFLFFFIHTTKSCLQEHIATCDYYQLCFNVHTFLIWKKCFEELMMKNDHKNIFSLKKRENDFSLFLLSFILPKRNNLTVDTITFFAR